MAPDALSRDTLLSASAVALSRRIASGELTASEVVERFLARIADVEPKIHSVAELFP